MIKVLVLISMGLFVCSFGQEKEHSSIIVMDSLAKRNTKTILSYSRKNNPSYNSEFRNPSELNKNVNQLLVNTINFNSLLNNRAVTAVDAGTLVKPRVNTLEKLGKNVFGIKAFKSK